MTLIVICARETCSIKKKNNGKLSVFKNDYFCNMLKVFRKNHIKMDDIKIDIGVAYKITDIIKKKRLKLFDYVVRKYNIYDKRGHKTTSACRLKKAGRNGGLVLTTMNFREFIQIKNDWMNENNCCNLKKRCVFFFNK